MGKKQLEKMNKKNKSTPETIGTESSKINVELSTRFLEHFSEQLYSSPQKAFEELISNGWDAGASYVDVRIADNLNEEGATLTVLDNGISMNEEGLRALWHIAYSQKKKTSTLHGRPVIGKFGIGKLATYVLANKLTYICKAEDGVIRRVTMDYTGPDLLAEQEDFMRDLQLTIYEVEEDDVLSALSGISHGKEVCELIRGGVRKPNASLGEDEFCSGESNFSPPSPGTWTLAILSDLKPTGKQLKPGILKRMLSAALPIGSELAIAVNGEILSSAKISTETQREWKIGPDLGFTSFEMEDNRPSTEEHSSASEPEEPANKKTVSVSHHTDPIPHITIQGINGMITGTIRLFRSKITSGKSEERGLSNGFHINVLGRVVNQGDISFGEENLSHAVWASFRMAVRADGLNEYLTTNREQFKERDSIKTFRAFLRKCFNIARSEYDSDSSAGLPDGGDALVKSLGIISLSPLRNIVSEALDGHTQIPGMFDDNGLDKDEDKKAKKESWTKETADNIRSAVHQVKYEKLTTNDELVKFRIRDNSIVVNKEHPFAAEHSKTKAEKELIRTVAMVNLLSDMYALDIGVAASKLKSIRAYRDKVMRFRALQKRESGIHIANILRSTQHDSKNYKHLETAVGDALKYIGFQVVTHGKPGEPEGVATAMPYPADATSPEPSLYNFTYDAKSSTAETTATNNLNLAGIADHRTKYDTNYALVVAPGFQAGSVKDRCEQQKITPMTANDLGRLLEYTVEHGAIPLTKLREVFSIYNPPEVTSWIDKLSEWLKTQRRLTLDIFLRALKELEGKIPDALEPGMIAYTCRENLKIVSVKSDDVISLVRGLSILVPDLVGIDNGKIVINASADRVAAAVANQLELLQTDTSNSD